MEWLVAWWLVAWCTVPGDSTALAYDDMMMLDVVSRVLRLW